MGNICIFSGVCPDYYNITNKKKILQGGGGLLNLLQCYMGGRGEEESLGTPKFYYFINGQGNLIMKDHVPIGKFYTWLNCFKYATFFFLVILEVL